MDHTAFQNDSNFYQTQSNSMSFDSRSSVNMTTPSAINLANRNRPVSQLDEKWKKTSSSDKEGWKTTSTKTNKAVESWKMSAKPRHSQLPQVQDDTNFRRHSAMPDMMNSTLPKPLPQEPLVEPFNLNLPPNDNTPPFHLNTPIQPPAFIRPNSFSEFSQPIQSYIHQHPPPSQVNLAYPHYVSNDMMYMTSNVEYHNPSYPPVIDNTYQSPHLEYQQQPIYSGITVVNDQPPFVPTTSAPAVPTIPAVQEKKNNNSKDSKDEKNKNAKKPEKRQITVQSINSEHKVWIDILPTETGKSLAEKIHIIATFRTRKVVSITTASGRQIPIDNRPVFGNWMDMEKFEDGERWTVEWRENDRGVMDRFFSKVVQGK